MYLLATGVVLSSILFSLPGILAKDDGRVPAHVVSIAATSREEIPFRRPCFGLRPEQIASDGPVCAMGKAGQPEYLLWGDSHALALAYGIDRAAYELGRSGRFLGSSGCPPGPEALDSASGGACQTFNQAVGGYLSRHPSITTIVLAGYWSYYYTQPNVDSFEANLKLVLRELTDKGYLVVVISQVPEPGWNVPSVLARSVWYGNPAPKPTTRLQQMNKLERFHAMIEKESSGRIKLIDVANSLCSEEACIVESNGNSLYRDGHHLSKAGSEFLKRQLRSDLFGDPGPK